MDMKIGVLLVGQNTIMRTALRRLLDDTEQISVVHESCSVAKACDLLARRPPGLTVVDWSISEDDVAAYLGRVADEYPEERVVVLGLAIEDTQLIEYFRTGLAAYLDSSASVETLVEAITQVHAEGYHICPTAGRVLVQGLRNSAQRPVETKSILTRREVEILQKLPSGMSNKALAETINTSESTVKTHLRSLYRKLEVEDRTQAILEGIRRGLISNDGEPTASTED